MVTDSPHGVLETRWRMWTKNKTAGLFYSWFHTRVKKGFDEGAIEALGEALGLCPQPVLAFGFKPTQAPLNEWVTPSSLFIST